MTLNSIFERLSEREFDLLKVICVSLPCYYLLLFVFFPWFGEQDFTSRLFITIGVTVVVTLPLAFLSNIASATPKAAHGMVLACNVLVAAIPIAICYASGSRCLYFLTLGMGTVFAYMLTSAISVGYKQRNKQAEVGDQRKDEQNG